MNQRPFGMPGPGGSLGQCAMCGKPFVLEIIMGKRVQSFTVLGVELTLFGHDDCIKAREGHEFDVTTLPPESPLRQAYERGKPS